MNKARFNALEKIFNEEINGTLPYQSRSKIYKILESDGLVEEIEIKQGIFAIKGWVLTQKGRMLYCQNCTNEE